MKTKIVYAIVSTSEDYYLEQLLLSVFSLRQYNSDAEVSVITDVKTGTRISGGELHVIDYIDNVACVEFADVMSNMERSRYIKTNLRKLVKGDYLFIDCDTVICGPLSDVDLLECEVGMVADINAHIPTTTHQSVIDKCAQAGYTAIEGEPYYNSGVIYCRDSERSHRLYEEWYRLWCESAKRGVTFDQPSLCRANINERYPICEISGIWNCQFKFSNEYVKNAKILHYYSVGSGQMHLFQNFIFLTIRQEKVVSISLQGIISSPIDKFIPLFSSSCNQVIKYLDSSLYSISFNTPKLYKKILCLDLLICRVYMKIRNLLLPS